MRRLLVVSLIALCTACASTDDAANKSASTESTYKQHPGRTLPLEEKAFVLAIEKLDRQAIRKELGEPAKADDVKIKDTDRVVASIWHYHFINTDENGKHYETTELDFVGDKLEQVVFINNDGSEEAPKEGRTYEIEKK